MYQDAADLVTGNGSKENRDKEAEEEGKKKLGDSLKNIWHGIKEFGEETLIEDPMERMLYAH